MGAERRAADFSKWIPDYRDVVSERSRSGQDLTFLKQEEEILAPWLVPGATLLDVGCATGYAFYNFAKYGVDYFGIDFVADYIEEGRRSLSARGLDPDHLQAVDLYAFADRGATFDVVTCNTVLQHLDDVAAAIGALSRMTGRVLLVRTLTADRDIIRKTMTHGETTLQWQPSMQSTVGISFNVYNEDALAAKLRRSFPAVEVIPDIYTTNEPVRLFATEFYSYSIFKCVR